MVNFLSFNYNLNTKSNNVKLKSRAARKSKMEEAGRIIQKKKNEGGIILSTNSKNPPWLNCQKKAGVCRKCNSKCYYEKKKH